MTNPRQIRTIKKTTSSVDPINPYSSATGGAWIQTASQGDNVGLAITSVVGNVTTSATKGPLFLDLRKSNGGTGTDTLASTDTAFDIYSVAAQLMSRKGDGRIGLGTNNPTYPMHLTRAPQSGALFGMIPTSLSTGDSIFYQIL